MFARIILLLIDLYGILTILALSWIAWSLFFT
jgi:hypothetical protein